MATFNKTEHYDLPLWGENDVMSLDSDVNGAMEKIDETMYNIASTVAETGSEVEDINIKVESHETGIAKALTDSNIAKVTADNSIAMIGDLSKLETGEKDNLVNAINSIQGADVGQLENDIKDIKKEINGDPSILGDTGIKGKVDELDKVVNGDEETEGIKDIVTELDKVVNGDEETGQEGLVEKVIEIETDIIGNSIQLYNSSFEPITNSNQISLTRANNHYKLTAIGYTGGSSAYFKYADTNLKQISAEQAIGFGGSSSEPQMVKLSTPSNTQYCKISLGANGQRTYNFADFYTDNDGNIVALPEISIANQVSLQAETLETLMTEIIPNIK